MKILAIETSCDETAAAVIKDGVILSSVIASQAAVHNKFGGVVPEVAAREHVPAIIPTIDLALKEAKTRLHSIDFLAVTNGPGLATSLHVGIDTAKTLALALDKPLLPVNHIEAHIYANFAGNTSLPRTRKSSHINIPDLIGNDSVFPALILIVSGGHTMLVLMKGHGNFRIIGETLDDAAGEAFDKSAKILGLKYPGGPEISRLAMSGNEQAYSFPRPMIKSGDLDFSYSGLKTAVLYEAQKLKKLDLKAKQNMAASLQAAIVESLVAKLEQAARKYKPKTIMLGGGVAANKKLREAFIASADNLGVNCSIPPLAYCTDNAAMIGLAAYFRIKNRKARFGGNISAEPNLRLK